MPTNPDLAALETVRDNFEAAANAMNEVVRMAWAENMPTLLHHYSDAKDAGPTVIAALAGIVTAMGYIAANFEPALDSDVLAGVMVEQFNEGRKTFFASQKGDVQ